jgi:signal transduction histidine kinase
MDLTNIVDDLLVAARAEIDVLTVARVAIDLRAQASQILEMHGSDQIEVVGADVRAWGDPARVRQILRNLVSNAMKYGRDPITIDVAKHGSTAVISVADRGEPIAKDDQVRIFEPYERAHRVAGVTASMGLGLPISRQLASLMGGSLVYVRTPDTNVFALELPLAVGDD